MQDGQHVVADLRPDRRDAGEQVTVLLEFGVFVDMVVDVALQLVKLLFQKSDRIKDGLLDKWRHLGGFGFFQPVPLPLQVLGDGLAPGQQRLGFAGFLARRRPGLRVE